jgi:lysylphosphatidylglycerol synthetase-like protein (DUF2156 family)
MCGTPVAADARFCPNCRRELRPVIPQVSAPPQPSPTAPPTAEEARERVTLIRPRGVGILTALTVIAGIIDLFAGVLFLAYATVSLSILYVIFVGAGPGALFSVLSFGCFIFGIVAFILAYGLWNGRGWAWIWTLISSILGLIVSIIGITVGVGIIGIVVYAIIIYYLTRARVRSFFGKRTLASQP